LEFIYDQLIIIGSYVLSYFMVRFNSDLKKILVPIPVKDKYRLGHSVIFKFIPLSESKADVPYNILILLLFLIFAFITKSVFNNTENWLLFWVGYMSVFMILLSITYKFIVILIITAIYAIPLGIAFAFGLGPKWIGIIVGIIPGVFGGAYIGINYWLTRARVDSEIYFKKDLKGEPIGIIKLTLRKVKSVWLKFSIILIMIAIVSFLMNWNEAVGTSIGNSSSIYQYSVIFVWTLISLNIFLFSIPLLIEMVQLSSWTSAGLFSDKIQDKEDDELKAYVNKFGKYKGFSLVTSLILGTMCLAIGAIIAGNIIEKLILGKVLAAHGNEYLVIAATFLSGFIFSVHVGFLLVYLFFTLIPKRFLEKEIKEPQKIISDILTSEAEIHRNMRTLLDEDQLTELKENQHDKDDATSAVQSILNDVIKSSEFHSILNFDNVALSEESKMLVSMAKYGQVKKRINKYLISDVFKAEIKPSKKFLRDALTFREYIHLRKQGLQDPNLRFHLDSETFFYPNVEIID